MIVITPKGIWSGGKRQGVLDLRSNRIGLAGIREEEWEYPAYHYFDRLARKVGDGISEKIEELEQEVEKGKILAFLGEPDKAVVVNAKEILRDQTRPRSERLEDKILEVLAKMSPTLVHIKEDKVKKGLKVLCKEKENGERTEIYILIEKHLLEEKKFRDLLRLVAKALQTAGKWTVELAGGKDSNREELAWIGEPRYKIEVFFGEKGHYHENIIRYRLNDLKDKVEDLDPDIYLVLTLYNIPPSITEFLPYLLNLSMGGSPASDNMEARSELGDMSQELANQGKGWMEQVKTDAPSRGRIVIFTRAPYNEVRLGYLEFETKGKEEDVREGSGGEEKRETTLWIVSEELGTGKQTMVEEDRIILLPKGVNIQTYSLMGLLGDLSLDDLDVKDIENIDKPGETSSYFSKGVGKVIWGLKKRLNISWAKVVCVAAPFALEGEDKNGYHFYFRERGGSASLSLVTWPGVSFSSALDRSIPLVRVEHDESFVVGSDHEATVEVITKLYERAKKILEGMYT